MNVAVFDLRVVIHFMQSLLNRVRIGLPEVRLSNEIKSSIIFWGQVGQDREAREAISIMMDRAGTVNIGEILVLQFYCLKSELVVRIPHLL